MKKLHVFGSTTIALLVALTSAELLAENKKYLERDNDRKSRLFEETKGKALEIGYMVARDIGFDIHRSGVDNIRITVNTNPSDTADAGDQIVEYWLNGELVAVGCHDESAGESYPGPCD